MRSCLDLLNEGKTESGIYTIDPDGPDGKVPEMNVYCDMDRHGGGGTLVGRFGAGNFRDLSNAQYAELLINPTEHVNRQALLHDEAAKRRQWAWYDKETTNAMWNNIEDPLVRIDWIITNPPGAETATTMPDFTFRSVCERDTSTFG